MGQLIPENIIRKIDSIGRITLPKGLRDRMYLKNEIDELEIFTAVIDNKKCICLSKPVDLEDEIYRAKILLEENGYIVEKGDV